MMKLYLSMVAMGSIGTLAYIIIMHLLPRNFDLRRRQRYLQWNISMYLLPYPWLICELKYAVRYLLEKAGVFIYREQVWESSTVDLFGSLKVVESNGDLICFVGYERWIPYLVTGTFICLSMIGIVMIRCITQANALRRNLESTGSILVNKGKIQIGVKFNLGGPVSVGIWKPIVIVPKDESIYGDSWNAVLKHEAAHVQNHDSFFRLLTAIVVAVEWYNPLAYYLVKEYIAVGELLCDQEATTGMEKEQKREYMKCILIAVEPCHRYEGLVQHFGATKKLTRRRLDYIMGNRKKTWKRRTSFLVALCCFGLSSIPAMAYDTPEQVQNMTEKEWVKEEWQNVDVLEFIPEDKNFADPNWHSVLEDDINLDFSESNILFMNENDSVWLIEKENNNNSSTRKICSHSYVAGDVAKHSPNGDGSCVVTIFEGKKCTKCGYTLTGKEKSSHKYATCPHK